MRDHSRTWIASRAALTIALMLGCVQRAPAAAGPFPDAAVTSLSNGAIVAAQTSPDTPLVDVQMFLPAGAAQQTFAKAGVAGVTASLVLATPVERGVSLSQAASALGASLTYTIDPSDTRFSIECKAADLPRLLGDLAAAARAPDAVNLEPVKKAAIATARKAISDPAMTAFAMIRESRFAGTAYARLDQGTPTSLQSIGAADVAAFAAAYRHGPGTTVALVGDVTPEALAAAKSAVADFSSKPGIALATPSATTRTQELVAHRDVTAPWVAVGYTAPSQYSADFPAMLVIESLLGRGADTHALAYGSGSSVPEDFVGGFYQFEAQPGLFIEFFNGANIDKDLHDLDDGIVRLRGTTLPSQLLTTARSAALGTYLTSARALDDQSWLLGRAALSPQNAGFENALAARIGSVSAADVQRVARRYLASQTIAVVLPNGVGQ